MNIERLRAVRDAILADSEYYNQQVLFRTKVNNCRSEACIAGRTILMFDLNGKEKEIGWLKYTENTISIPFQAFEVAGDLLDLSPDEQERLFNEINIDEAKEADEDEEYAEDYLGWPLKFARMYENATTGLERAQAAAARIDFFIETDSTDKVAAQEPVVE